MMLQIILMFSVFSPNRTAAAPASEIIYNKIDRYRFSRDSLEFYSLPLFLFLYFIDECLLDR